MAVAIQADPTANIKLNVYKPTVQDFKVKMMIYGPPGIGKTTLALSAVDHAQTRDVLVINVEGGLLSVVDKMEHADVVDYTNLKGLQDICWFLIKSKHNYKTVVLDSLSELQMTNIEAIVKAEVATRKNPNRVSEDDIWQEDYKASTAQLRRVTRAFRDLPMHVVFTCHDHTTSTSDGTVSKIHPALTPKLRQSVIGYIDILGYMFIKEIDNKPVRHMLVQPTGKFDAKDRSPGSRLGTTIVEPSIPKIIDTIQNKIASK